MQRVRKLAALEETTQQELIARALEAFERAVLLDRLNASFARMREDPRAWRKEQRERRAWEGTTESGRWGTGCPHPARVQRDTTSGSSAMARAKR